MAQAAVISNTKTIVVFINQLRQKISVVYRTAETTTGSNALEFYCSVRLEVRRTKANNRGDGTIRTAPLFGEADFEILKDPPSPRSASWVDTSAQLGSSTSRAPGTRTNPRARDRQHATRATAVGVGFRRAVAGRPSSQAPERHGAPGRQVVHALRPMRRREGPHPTAALACSRSAAGCYRDVLTSGRVALMTMPITPAVTSSAPATRAPLTGAL